MANSADPDQLASSEANWSGSTLFTKTGYIWVQQDKGSYWLKLVSGALKNSLFLPARQRYPFTKQIKVKIQIDIFHINFLFFLLALIVPYLWKKHIATA